MDAETIDAMRVEVALRYRLAKIAIYRSFAGVVILCDRQRAFGRLSVQFGIVSINGKLQNDVRRRIKQHL